MMQDLLARLPTNIIQLQAPLTEDLPPFEVRGLLGGSDFVSGICVGGEVLDRLPLDPICIGNIEQIDRLILRAVRTLPPSKEKAVLYLIYRGLPAEHCRPPA